MYPLGSTSVRVCVGCGAGSDATGAALLQTTEEMLSEMTGPGLWESWVHWRSATPENRRRAAVRTELDKTLHADHVSGIRTGPRWDVGTIRQVLKPSDLLWSDGGFRRPVGNMYCLRMNRVVLIIELGTRKTS